MKTELLPIVDCPPPPLARGRAHGEALRGVIRDKVGRWHEAIGEAYREPAAPFLSRFLEQTSFRAAVAVHTPGLLDEVRGIAEGAGLAEETAFALQLMDEEWWWGAAGLQHCSGAALAPAGGAPTAMGQTMDLPAWHDGAQALLRLTEEDGTETLVFTSAGMIGLMGLSSRGLGLCVNTLAALRPNSAGLPVAFVARGALLQAEADGAAAFLRRVPHASGQNYLLGDRRGVRAFECSAAGAVEVSSADGRILHTNHPLASADLREGGGGGDRRQDSIERLGNLAAGLGESVTSPAALRTALSAHRDRGGVSLEVPENAGLLRPMTVGAVVYEIAAAEERLWVAAGPPSREEWRPAPLARRGEERPLRVGMG
ncbi:MAG TPA: C45 family peptidase [Mesorhizobium sp.]|jgi:hypothetical protein|nr:C45 family peptidase [Mesorhizobium sp.]